MMIENKYFWDVFWFEYHDFGPLLMNGWYKSGFGGLDINNVCELRPFNNRLQRNPNHLCKAAKVSPAQKTTPFNLKGVFVGPHLQFVKKNTTFDFLDFPTQSHLFRDSPNILTILLCLIPFLWWIFSLIPQIHREIHLEIFAGENGANFPPWEVQGHRLQGQLRMVDHLRLLWSWRRLTSGWNVSDVLGMDHMEIWRMEAWD